MINGLFADAFVDATAVEEAGNGRKAESRPTKDTARLSVRKAAMRDIPRILDLINGYAANGIMLPRTEFELSEALRDFSVVHAGEEFLGCGALHFYSPAIAEIRSLAVHEYAKTQGVGRRLVEALVAEADLYELAAVFAFTYVAEFFTKVGFQVVERGVLPLKAWKDCVRCPKFQACDEIAVLRILRPESWHGIGPADTRLALSPLDELIQIPIPLG
ncbi:MAG TPA: N-acetyltransferase [Bryobacteraceae bacterium]|nr:N-acetyltransferase [Bryobacteraceae bacterium]